MAVKVRMIEVDTTYQSHKQKQSKKSKTIIELKKIYDAMIKRDSYLAPDELSQDLLRGLEVSK